jgi:hypothetical protein
VKFSKNSAPSMTETQKNGLVSAGGTIVQSLLPGFAHRIGNFSMSLAWFVPKCDFGEQFATMVASTWGGVGGGSGADVGRLGAGTIISLQQVRSRIIVAIAVRIGGLPI